MNQCPDLREYLLSEFNEIYIADIKDLTNALLTVSLVLFISGDLMYGLSCIYEPEHYTRLKYKEH